MKKMCFMLPFLFAFLMTGCTFPNSSMDATEVQTIEACTEEEDIIEVSMEESTDTAFSKEEIVEVDFERELKETDNPRIAELLNVSGGYSLVTNSVIYDVFEYENITAIVVTVPYPNDCMDYLTYTYDFKDNKEITNAGLLAMIGLTEEGFVEEVCRLQEEDFIELAEDWPNPMTDQEMMNEYIAIVNEYASADLPMYIDETGRLQVYIPFASIAGADWYYQLRDFPVGVAENTTGDTLIDGESEEQPYAFQCSEPAPFKEIIDRYGYVDGYSVLSFDIVPQTVEEYEEYYAVDAVYSQLIEVPGNLAIGERITVIFNELTEDERTLERREDGLYQLEDEENEPYYPTYFQYWAQEDDAPAVLYDENTDRVDKPVFDGKLYIRKDATIEYVIEHNVKAVTKEELNREYLWFNGVYFDENGYVTRLVYYGD